MEPTVTLETKCWEGDWQRILLTDHLPRLAERNCYPFSDTVLLVNNVKDPGAVCRCAERAQSKGWLTRIVVVEEHAEEALGFFGLTRNCFRQGYLYSIAELVGIYLCPSDYLLHYSADSLPTTGCQWVPQALSMMGSCDHVKVANLAWHAREAEAEAVAAGPDWYVSQGFSDQCYLIRSRDFRSRIYSEQHPASARYPGYGGELSEKRVDAWMRNHHYLRITFRHGRYLSAP